MSRTVILVIVILMILMGSYLTRINDEVLESIIVTKMEEELMEDEVINEVLLVDLMSSSISGILEENVHVKDYFFYKIVEVNGIITGKYISVVGRLFNYSDTKMDVSLFSIWYENNSGNSPRKLTNEQFYDVGEYYATVTNEDGSYKIIKLNIGVVYTNAYFESSFENKSETLDTYVKEYFKTETFESIVHRDTLSRMSDEMLVGLTSLYETDNNNFTRIIISDFEIK